MSAWESAAAPSASTLAFVARLAAEATGAAWAAVCPPRGGAPVWADSDAAPPPEIAASIDAAPDAAPGALVRSAGRLGVSVIVLGLPDPGGRIVLADRTEPRMGPEAEARLRALAELAAARLARDVGPPAEASELARLGWFRIDRASGRAVWSPGIYRLYGYDPRDGAPTLAMILDAFPPAAQSDLRRAISRSWETGAEAAVAAAIRRLDGAQRDVIVRLRADAGPGGLPRATLSGVMLDVSEARAFDDRILRERALLRTTLESMDQGLMVVESDLSVPVLNRRLTELLGLPESFVDTRPSLPEILDHQRAQRRLSLEALTARIESLILDPDGRLGTQVEERETPDGRSLEIRTARLPSGGYVRTFTDQTARRERERAIALSQEEYRLLFENAAFGIYRSAPGGRLLRANRALATINGYDTPEEFVARANAEAFDWYVQPGRVDDFLETLNRDGIVREFMVQARRHATGEIYWLSQTAWLLRDAEGRVLAHEDIVIDATERKRAEERIARDARRDPLTGLPNRLRFLEALEAALAGSRQPVAVLLLDLDRLKTINDGFGHAGGDAALRAVAGRFADLAAPGRLVARFGGDEFALLLEGGSAEAATDAAEAAREALAPPVEIEGRALALTASVGVALAPGDATTSEALLRCADLALYRAKAEGRDRLRFYEPSMAAPGADRRRIARDLAGAAGRGELGLCFQPILDLASGAEIGREALLRWTHPEHGAIAPEDFVPAAEDARLIGEIGGWALARAAAEAATWPPGVELWVNVSPVQLAESDFEPAVDAALAAAGLASDRLFLEVTETALMQGGPDLAERLARLRARGLRVALDDFGSGYSSLGYLRRLPFDAIKLDRSFAAALDDPTTSAIVECVLELGRRLGVPIIAEGVETDAQRHALAAAGCRFAQGIALAPPRPADGAA